MLREVRNAAFPRQVHGRIQIRHRGLSSASYASLMREQVTTPRPLANRGGQRYWMFEDGVFWDDEDLTPEDVLALVRDRDRRRERKLERARANVAAGEAPRAQRDPIPREVRLAVFERDGGRCVECGSNFELRFDHVIPVAMGGASTLENLQVLCGTLQPGEGRLSRLISGRDAAFLAPQSGNVRVSGAPLLPSGSWGDRASA